MNSVLKAILVKHMSDFLKDATNEVFALAKEGEKSNPFEEEAERLILAFKVLELSEEEFSKYMGKG